MTPLQRYRQDLDNGIIIEDPQQQKIVAALQSLYEQLPTKSRDVTGVSARLLRWLKGKPAPNSKVSGLYLWGGVGRGKTYLMDLFFDCLPEQRKLRTHFHRFMQRVHRDLASYQGVKNPLQRVAEKIAGEAKIVCFDEFFVLDIGDAMILSGLLQALFEQDVILITTSNINPDGLYENGLQRERFLPAIDLIKKHTRVIEIESGTDYRLRNLSQANLYYCPVNDESEALMLANFTELVPDKEHIEKQFKIDILGRQLLAKYCEDDVIWFDFSELCEGPRSASDYVEIAKLYHAIYLSAVPEINAARDDQGRRFISLIDELYDRRVKLIMSAEVDIGSLYSGTSLEFAFERTRSRLLEMQSYEYLALQHRP